MADDDPFLIDVADAVLDGRPVDWTSAASSATDSQRALIAHLQAVAGISSFGIASAARESVSAVPAIDNGAFPRTWGPLTVLARIGRGSFGDVYRAVDPRLDRPVALKLLRHHEHGGETAESAVIAEGRLMARVRHPNVVTIYGAERDEGRVGLWMELVDGRTLEDELRERGPLPAAEVARIGVDLCRALEAIHRAGLLHRDLKAQNVLRDRDGSVRVTDFGAGLELTDAPDGVAELAGTPLYLAPEVLAGAPATARSDVYSLGVLLFHLLTASYPVTGRSLAQVREAHEARRRSRLSEVRPDLDDALKQAVDRALAFDPGERHEGAQAMEVALARVSGSSEPAARTDGRRRRAFAVGVAALVTVAVAVAVVLLRERNSETIALGRHTRVTADAGLEIDPAVSPDGRRVAYSAGVPGRMRLFIQETAGGQPVALTDRALGDERRPRWSPDGGRLLFTAADVLATVPPSGGAVPTIVARSPAIRSAFWSPDGRNILFISGSSLFRVPAAGGTPVAVRTLEDDAVGLSVSPDGSRIAYVTGNADFSIGTTQFANIGPSTVRLADLEGGPAIDLTDRAHVAVSPVWSADGRSLLFVSDLEGHRDLYVVDVDRRGAPGPARRVTSGLDAHAIGLSADGRVLAYSVFSRRANLWSVAIPPRGVAGVSEARQLTTGTQIIEDYVATPDGRWLYFDSDRYGNPSLFRVRLDGGDPERLTSGPGSAFINGLSPNGRELAFHTFQNGRREVFVMPAEGGQPRFVAAGLAASWSPDGSSLVIADVVVPDAGTTHRVLKRGRDGQWGPPRSLGGVRCTNVAWKPDGQGFVALCGHALQERALDGTVTRTLYRPGDAREPVPSYLCYPGGDTAYFKSYGADGYPSFWAMPVTGGTPRLVFHQEDRERHASRKAFWTDGRQLYFTLEERQSDVWVVPVDGHLR